MIKIKRNNSILEVSKETYKSMFKRLGYEIIDEGASKIASSDNKKITNKKNNMQDTEISSNNDKKDIFSKNTDNLSIEEKKDLKIDSKDKSDVYKEEKSNNLEDILGMLSDNAKEEKKNNNKK